jgi:hypothetical protein
LHVVYDEVFTAEKVASYKTQSVSFFFVLVRCRRYEEGKRRTRKRSPLARVTCAKEKLTIPIHNLIDPIRKNLLCDSCSLSLQLLIPSLLPVLPSILAMIKLTQKLKPIIHLTTMLSSLPHRIHRGTLSPRNFGVGFDPQQMLTCLKHRSYSQHEHKTGHPEFILIPCFAEDLVQAVERAIVLLHLHFRKVEF